MASHIHNKIIHKMAKTVFEPLKNWDMIVVESNL